MSILPQLRFQQFFSQVRTSVLALLHSAVLVIAQQPHVKGSAKASLIFSYLLLGLKETNIYVMTCKETLRMLDQEARKGQTLNPNNSINPQEVLNSDRSYSQRKNFSYGRNLSVLYFPL